MDRIQRGTTMTNIRNSARVALFSSAALRAFVAGGTASAQEQPAPPPGASTTEETGETITVTAQKREEAILDIPQSVTVVGGETLERQRATSFQDYASLIPGLSLRSEE